MRVILASPNFALNWEIFALWFALSKAVHALLVELLEVKPGENDFAMEWRDSKWARQCSNARFVIDEVLSISSFTRISSRTIRRRSSSFMESSISLEAFLTDFRKLQLRQNVSLARLRLGEKIYSFWMLSPSWIVTDTTASTADAPSILALLSPNVSARTELSSQKEHGVNGVSHSYLQSGSQRQCGCALCYEPW